MELFQEYFIEVLKKYTVFTGRARRKEYWMFTLFYIVIYILLTVVAGLLSNLPGVGVVMAFIPLVFCLALLVPSIAVAIRRLHDTNRSGWWLLLGFVPVIGGIVLLVFLVKEGTPGENQFGANPKG